MNGVISGDDKATRRKKTTPQSILGLLRHEQALLSAVLKRVKSEGRRFLDSFERGAVQKLEHAGMYRISDQANAAFIPLRDSKAFLGRRFEEPCIIVPIWVGKPQGEENDIFLLYIRHDLVEGIRTSIEWHKDPSRCDWPQEEKHLKEIGQRVLDMTMIFSCTMRTSLVSAAA